MTPRVREAIAKHEAALKRLDRAELAVIIALKEWAKEEAQNAIAKELGFSPQHLNDLLHRRRRWSRQATA